MAGPIPPRPLPMLARSGPLPRSERDWAFEAKWDGVRAIALADAGRTRLLSRRGEEVTVRYPELEGLAGALAGHRAVLDGEIVCLGERGRPDFHLLQARIGLASPDRIARLASEHPVTLMLFDLLSLDGEDLTGRPWTERRAALEALELAGPWWQVPPVSVGDAEAMLHTSRDLDLEGVVAKRLASPYAAGRRSADWVKVRHLRRQELVICGYRPGRGSRAGRIGSLVLGVHDRSPEEAATTGERPRLVYAGSVGTGFSERDVDELTALLRPLERDSSPFDPGEGMGRGGHSMPKRDAVFCEPRLVCEVEFAEWTREGSLRAPSFKGLRDDKDPAEVVREA